MSEPRSEHGPPHRWRDRTLYVLGWLLHGGSVVVGIPLVSDVLAGHSIAERAWVAVALAVPGMVGVGIWTGAADRLDAESGRSGGPDD